MALTKVRPPVTDISLVSNGTTAMTIATPGADFDIDVAGLQVLTIGSTSITVDDLVTLIANTITGESISLSTSGGATLPLLTEATKSSMVGTTAHPVELGANSIVAMTMDTAGQVELDVVGTAINHLVDKNYVDNQVGGVIAESDFGTTQASTGHIVIPTSTGTPMLINWGTNPSVPNNSVTTVTFDLAFPNAMFVGFVTPTTQANHDGTMEVVAKATATMDIHSSLDKASAFDYMAIGY